MRYQTTTRHIEEILFTSKDYLLCPTGPMARKVHYEFCLKDIANKLDQRKLDSPAPAYINKRSAGYKKNLYLYFFIEEIQQSAELHASLGALGSLWIYCDNIWEKNLDKTWRYSHA